MLKAEVLDELYPQETLLELDDNTKKDFIHHLKNVASTLAPTGALMKTMAILYISPENDAFFKEYSSKLNQENYKNYLHSYSTLMNTCSTNDSARAYVKSTIENFAIRTGETQALSIILSKQDHKKGYCPII